MTKRKRELLKFRECDCGLKIRKDGQLEVAGVDETGGMIDKNGMVNPVLLFAAAWARRDQKVFQVLIDNFKESVREGLFGPEAKRDYEKADKLKQEEEAKKPPPPFLNPEKKVEAPVLDPDSKPTVTAPSASVVGSLNTGVVASGAVTFEQPEPLDIKGHLDRRDS